MKQYCRITYKDLSITEKKEPGTGSDFKTRATQGNKNKSQVLLINPFHQSTEAQESETKAKPRLPEKSSKFFKAKSPINEDYLEDSSTFSFLDHSLTTNLHDTKNKISKERQDDCFMQARLSSQGESYNDLWFPTMGSGRTSTNNLNPTKEETKIQKFLLSTPVKNISGRKGVLQANRKPQNRIKPIAKIQHPNQSLSAVRKSINHIQSYEMSLSKSLLSLKQKGLNLYGQKDVQEDLKTSDRKCSSRKDGPKSKEIREKCRRNLAKISSISTSRDLKIFKFLRNESFLLKNQKKAKTAKSRTNGKYHRKVKVQKFQASCFRLNSTYDLRASHE
ncbi:unnamed protein product [Moneuplotes crassus]|uniref:Uncharacterized protein n=1 Tax=Euplotes crassus TaxID=5936 RepID=A0AAD1UH59_EUPCR|nr:unnamed protein product [Moneuplotes crassus]